MLTQGELLAAFIGRVDLTRLSEELAALPTEFLEELRACVQTPPTGVPWSLCYLDGIGPEESRRLHSEILERNRLAIEAIKSYFDASS
jgi:hypothetical protein